MFQLDAHDNRAKLANSRSSFYEPFHLIYHVSYSDRSFRTVRDVESEQSGIIVVVLRVRHEPFEEDFESCNVTAGVFDSLPDVFGVFAQLPEKVQGCHELDGCGYGTESLRHIRCTLSARVV